VTTIQLINYNRVVDCLYLIAKGVTWMIVSHCEIFIVIASIVELNIKFDNQKLLSLVANSTRHLQVYFIDNIVSYN